MELSGNALVCAEAFGNGDATKGASYLLETAATVWMFIHRREFEGDEESDISADGDGCASHLGDDEELAWGFGITAHLNAKQLAQSFASIMGAFFSSLAAPEDHDKLVTFITDAVIHRGAEFADVLAPRIFRVIADTFRDALKAAVATVEKETAFLAGDVYTVERRSEISSQIDKAFAERYPPPPLVEFSGMRGGASVTALLPPLSDKQLAAYAPLVARFTPLWRRITSYRRDYPDTWASDVHQLPEVKKLKTGEVKAMKEVIAAIPYGRHTIKGSGAPIRPATCAREHARIALRISERPDKKLIEALKANAPASKN